MPQKSPCQGPKIKGAPLPKNIEGLKSRDYQFPVLMADGVIPCCNGGLPYVLEGDELFCCLTFSSLTQGYQGMVHGGIIATVLDDAMVCRLAREGLGVVTAKLDLRYRQPISILQEVEIRVGVELRKPPVYLLWAEITNGSGRLCSARGTFMEKRLSSLAQEFLEHITP